MRNGRTSNPWTLDDPVRHALRQMLVNLLLLATAPFFTTATSGASSALEDELAMLGRADLLPLLRPATSLGLASSYDRSGGNDDGLSGDTTHVVEDGGGHVLLDVSGSGVVQRIWMPDPTGVPVDFYFDGEPQPRLSITWRELFSGQTFPFVAPLVGRELGGSYSYVPIPFARSLRIVHRGAGPARPRYYQIQYRLDARHSESFRPRWSDAELRALDELRRNWSECEPGSAAERGDLVETRSFLLRPGTSEEIFRSDGGGRIVSLEVRPAAVLAGRGRRLLLRANWDDEERPAILAPLADLVGFAFGHGAARSWLLGSDDDTAYFRFPMPFDQRASLTLQHLGPANADDAETLLLTVRIVSRREERRADEGRLYAVWKRAIPAVGSPLELVGGGGRGHQVATLLHVQGHTPGSLEFFEGDETAILDGVVHLRGTGTEDYFNGGWYGELDRWDTVGSLPLHGSLAYSEALARTGGYRFFVGDRLSYERSLRLELEHGGAGNQAAADYSSTVLLYADSPPDPGDLPTLDNTAIPKPSSILLSGLLLELSLDRGAAAERRADGLLVLSTKSASRYRLAVRDAPPGRYAVRARYLSHPDGADFRISHRKDEPSVWTSTQGDQTEPKEVDLGILDLRHRAPTLSLLVRSGGESRAIWLIGLELTPIDDSQEER